MRHLLPAFATSLVCLTAACAPLKSPVAPPPDRPVVTLTSTAELSAVPVRPASQEAFALGDRPKEDWTFTPDDGSAPATSPWLTVLQQAAGENTRVRSHGPLACAAREIGEYYARHHSFPDDAFRRFAVARCGGVLPNVRAFMWSGSAPAGSPDAQLIAHTGAGFKAYITGKLAKEGDVLAGTRTVWEGSRFYVAVLFATADVTLAPGFALAEGRKVHARGMLRRPGERVFAWINQGAMGVAPCIVDPAVGLPAFDITCTLAPADTHAWVSLAAMEKGRPLLRPVGDFLAYEGAPPTTYPAPPKGSATPADGSTRQQQILAVVNERRRAGKLAPLTLAAEQSDDTQRLAGTLLESLVAGDTKTADTITLGLLAGWRVPGLVQEGNVFLSKTTAPSAEAWVDDVLAQPLGRVVLLEPSARTLAVGVEAAPGSGHLGGVAFAYSHYGDEAHGADEATLRRRIEAARPKTAAALRPLEGGELMAKALTRVQQGEHPSLALRELLDAMSQREGRSVVGWVVEGLRADDLQLPTELQDPTSYGLVVGVTHRRAAGAAWGQLTAFVLAVP